jgi:hypothetical protein
MRLLFVFILAIFLTNVLNAQDTLPPVEEEDYSLYDDVEFVDVAARQFCSAKILGLSPTRFVSIGWDAQLPYDMSSSRPGEYQPDDDFQAAETSEVRYTGGLRMDANIPVISRNSFIWQMGGQFRDVRYQFSDRNTSEGSAGLQQTLEDKGLRTFGLNTTLFKPINERDFLLFQGGANLSGDYTLNDLQSLKYLRYSAAILWGKRPSDYLQWAVGVARTYRVGELNYVPVILFNWTAVNRKWGAEVLAPARGHLRYTFDTRSLLLAGYALEGQSYRLNDLSENGNSLEIRRGELRLRLEYQRQLTGFIWVSAQAGWRNNWSFHVDELEGGDEFFRGFFGDQTYRLLNDLGDTPYFNISIHLVSP